MADDGTKRLLLLRVKMLQVVCGGFGGVGFGFFLLCLFPPLHTPFVGGALKENSFAVGGWNEVNAEKAAGVVLSSSWRW